MLFYTVSQIIAMNLNLLQTLVWTLFCSVRILQGDLRPIMVAK